ncbi:MAG: sensor histidine kinase N-terminal domain-containing protein, partial [Proteobacteria bacterium]|nr:sensor histidine kinase N-terminal domain-containing protein [Pseudomonadota bacterium]
MASASLRRRLVAGLLAALVVTWGAVGAAIYRDTSREVDAVLDAHLAQTASLIAAQAGHELIELGFEPPEEALPYGQPVAFQVWDRTGRLVLHSANAPPTPFSDRAAGFVETSVAGRHWRVLAATTRDAALRVLVAEDLASRERLETRFVVRVFAPLALGLLGLGALIWLIVGRALRPLAALRAELARRDAHELAPLATHAVPAEVEPLIAQMNALFGRIARSFEAERRFTAQAAHELRTPVAAIRAQAEAAAGASDAAETRRALGRVVEGCDRLARLVGQLLVVGRL